MPTENQGDPTSEAAKSDEAPARSSVFVRCFRYLWPLLCLFQLGLILGWVRPWEHTNPAHEATGEEPPPLAFALPEGVDGKQAPQAASDLEHADILMRESSYAHAFAIYQPLSKSVTVALQDPLQYRLGLCLEGLGRWDQALASYRSLAGRSRDPKVAAAAQLGQARVWIRMRRPAEAKVLLGNLILRSAEPALRDHPFLGDAKYLLALALAGEVTPQDKPNSFNNTVAFAPANDGSVERVLDWAAPATHGTTEQKAPPKASLAVHRLGSGAEEVLVSAQCNEIPVGEVVDQLLRESGLISIWTTRAREQVAERTAILRIENMPLPDVIRCLTEPFGLFWEVQEKTFRFSGEEEASPDDLRSQRRLAAARALRDAVVAFPKHPFTAAAFLEAGNLEAAAGHWNEAASWYGRLIREMSHSSAVVEANYNLGIMLHLLGDYPASRQALYRVPDKKPGHELAPLAYLRVGRQLLEDEGDPERAIQPLRRALNTGTGTSNQPAAALTLATAYLLTDNPRAAQGALAENRALLNQPPYQRSAAFLSGYASFRSTLDRKQRQQQSGKLLSAVLGADTNLLGVSGGFLLGQAFLDLGMPEPMIALYERILPQCQGPLAEHMTYLLGETLLAVDKDTEARKRFEEAARLTGGEWTHRCRVRLAELDLRQNHAHECLVSCRKLLTETQSDRDKAEVLRLMGKAHEQLGEHEQAARCFAGRMPAR